jgi:hypothetical protein
MSLPDLSLGQLYSVRGKVALGMYLRTSFLIIQVTGGGTGIGKMITVALVQNGAKGNS